MAPVPGALDANRRLIERAIERAAAHGANWIVTPELCSSGYAFSGVIGTDWIAPQPDAWMQSLARRAARLRVTLFLGVPEQDRETGRLHNSVFVVGPDGTVLGSHRKIQTLPVGAEAWSTPGRHVSPTAVPPFDKVGLLICADAYPRWIASDLGQRGANILVSPASWAPGAHGPNGEWERCSGETGLPVIVCNRTGVDRTLDFRRAQSAVVVNGQRTHSLSSESSALFLIDWDLDQHAPLLGAVEPIPV